jgi:hypothetical protein
MLGRGGAPKGRLVTAYHASEVGGTNAATARPRSAAAAIVPEGAMVPEDRGRKYYTASKAENWMTDMRLLQGGERYAAGVVSQLSYNPALSLAGNNRQDPGHYGPSRTAPPGRSIAETGWR